MLAINVLFLHRIVYNSQKEKIDRAYNITIEMFNKYSKLLIEKIPKYVEPVKKN
jgi:hypothetical protein